MGEWSNGICGCFGNIGMCIFTYVVPCYTQGKLAESLGDDCLLCGISLMVPLLNIYARLVTRGKVRENKGIEGGLIGDLLCVCCCPFCALMQEAQEMSVSTPLGAVIHHLALSLSTSDEVTRNAHACLRNPHPFQVRPRDQFLDGDRPIGSFRRIIKVIYQRSGDGFHRKKNRPKY